MRVVIAEDLALLRDGLTRILDAFGFQVVEAVADGPSVLPALTRHRPDVAVVDVRLPDGGGVELCRGLRSLPDGPRCLVLTAFDDEEALVGAIMAGASGYLLKQVRGQDLVNAVREVAAGGSLLDPLTTARVLDRLRRPAQVDVLDALTEQERRVLELIGEGLTNRQIAERLFLAEKTVKNYVTAVLSKLGMERRTQAAAWVARRSR